MGENSMLQKNISKMTRSKKMIRKSFFPTCKHQKSGKRVLVLLKNIIKRMKKLKNIECRENNKNGGKIFQNNESGN